MQLSALSKGIVQDGQDVAVIHDLHQLDLAQDSFAVLRILKNRHQRLRCVLRDNLKMG